MPDMQIKDRIDDRGVSPVIGVILMVAITVILAAVIASFVLGMGPGEGGAPTASFSAEQAGTDNLEITLDSSGEDIDPNNIEISSGSESVTWETVSTGSGSEITAGSSVTVGTGTGDDIDVDTTSSYTVDVVYTGGDGSSVMQTFEG